jgi:hypothetical protein
VLVPGAGLGRLAFEVAWQGYSCQGNEYSFFMLLASHVRLEVACRLSATLTRALAVDPEQVCAAARAHHLPLRALVEQLALGTGPAAGRAHPRVRDLLRRRGARLTMSQRQSIRSAAARRL